LSSHTGRSYHSLNQWIFSPQNLSTCLICSAGMLFPKIFLFRSLFKCEFLRVVIPSHPIQNSFSPFHYSVLPYFASFFFIVSEIMYLCICLLSSNYRKQKLYRNKGYFFWDSISQTICLSWLLNAILLISAFQVVRITGVSHWLLAQMPFLWALFPISVPQPTMSNIPTLQLPYVLWIPEL
jgi:hypothetical protein